MMRHFLGLILAMAVAAAFCGCRSTERPAKWAQPVDFRSGPRNFYRVDKELYRSAKPNLRQLSQFEAVGGKSVLYLCDDAPLQLPTSKSQLNLYQIKVSPARLNEAQVIEALSIIREAPKPLLICDLRGADAAGVVMAAYRIVFDKWTEEEAKREMKDGGYGFSAMIYPNLEPFVDNTDWTRVVDRVFWENAPVLENEKREETAGSPDAVVSDVAETAGTVEDAEPAAAAASGDEK